MRTGVLRLLFKKTVVYRRNRGGCCKKSLSIVPCSGDTHRYSSTKARTLCRKSNGKSQNNLTENQQDFNMQTPPFCDSEFSHYSRILFNISHATYLKLHLYKWRDWLHLVCLPGGLLSIPLYHRSCSYLCEIPALGHLNKTAPNTETNRKINQICKTRSIHCKKPKWWYHNFICTLWWYKGTKLFILNL